MLFKNLKKLNLIMCLAICFSLLTNVVFAGSDLENALSPDVESVNDKDNYDYYQNHYENTSKAANTNSISNTDSSYKFVENFINAVNNEDISEIKYYLQKGEDEIVKMFKQIEDLKHPKTWAYYWIAEGNFRIGRKETAYNYFSNAIEMLSKIQNADPDLKAILFRERAFCIFSMRDSNNFEDYNVKKAFADLNKSLNINSNDWITYYYAGTMNIVLGDRTDTGINQLIQAKNLCKDSNIKNNIQQEIDDAKSGNFWKGVGEFALGFLWGFLSE